jgi:hypothetical protein
MDGQLAWSDSVSAAMPSRMHSFVLMCAIALLPYELVWGFDVPVTRHQRFDGRRETTQCELHAARLPQHLHGCNERSIRTCHKHCMCCSSEALLTSPALTPSIPLHARAQRLRRQDRRHKRSHVDEQHGPVSACVNLSLSLRHDIRARDTPVWQSICTLSSTAAPPLAACVCVCVCVCL